MSKVKKIELLLIIDSYINTSYKMVDAIHLFDHNHNHKCIFQKMIERQPADKSKLNKYCNCIVTDADTNEIFM